MLNQLVYDTVIQQTPGSTRPSPAHHKQYQRGRRGQADQQAGGANGFSRPLQASGSGSASANRSFWTRELSFFGCRADAGR
jgi:hypothetical protein